MNESDVKPGDKVRVTGYNRFIGANKSAAMPIGTVCEVSAYWKSQRSVFSPRLKALYEATLRYDEFRQKTDAELRGIAEKKIATADRATIEKMPAA